MCCSGGGDGGRVKTSATYHCLENSVPYRYVTSLYCMYTEATHRIIAAARHNFTQ